MSDVDLKVEVVQRVVAAMVAGDPEEVLPLIDPAVEREAIGGMEPGVDRGVEQIVAPGAVYDLRDGVPLRRPVRG